jgi:hypothetical protein
MKKHILLAAVLPLLFDFFGGVERTLQNGIDAIDRNSEQWQIEVKRLEDNLVLEGQSTLKNEVQSVVERSFANGVYNLKCNEDHIGHGIANDLRRNLAKLRQLPIPPLKPEFCEAQPAEVDVETVLERRLTSLYYYGYNLFDKDAADTPIKVYLRHWDGTEQDISFAIAFPTHYLMTIALADHRIHYDEESGDQLVFRDGDVELNTINVFPPPPAVTLGKFGVAFHTEGVPQKDNDTGITLEINGVKVWSMPQSGGIATAFAAGHNDFYPFTVSPPPPLATFSGKKMKICIQPNGRNDWKFSMRLFASRSDSPDFAVPFSRSTCAVNPPSFKCYIDDETGVTLTRDDPCKDFILGAGSVAN